MEKSLQLLLYPSEVGGATGEEAKRRKGLKKPRVKDEKRLQLQVNELGNENSGTVHVSFYYRTIPRGKGRD